MRIKAFLFASLTWFSVLLAQNLELTTMNFTVDWPCSQPLKGSTGENDIYYKCNEGYQITSIKKDFQGLGNDTETYRTKFLSEYRSLLSKQPGVIYCKEVTMLGYKGFRYQMLIEQIGVKMYSTSIIFLRKNISYTISILIPENAEEVIFDKFIDSFKFTDE
jgi:hypothetical protein